MDEVMKHCNTEMVFKGYTQATHVAYAHYVCPVCGKVVVSEFECERYTEEEP